MQPLALRGARGFFLSGLGKQASHSARMNATDEVISGFYSAAANRTTWEEPLQRLSAALGLWATQIIGVDKQRGGLVFSACGWGMKQQPEVELDYIRFFHSANPRLTPALQLRGNQWFHCHEVFDERFVEGDTFYQEFLIPHGGRYISGTKLIDDEHHVFLLGAMRGAGSQPLGATDMDMLATVRHHAVEALKNQLHLRAQFAEFEMAKALFDQFSYPMLVLDEARGIWHMNSQGRDLLRERDILRDEGGVLMCGSATANNLLTEAIRSLHLSAGIQPHDIRRRVVTLDGASGRTWRLFLSPLRPEQSMGMFGAMPRALLIVHEDTDSGGDLDPLLVAECFSLTPAEARVAVRIAHGQSPKEIAAAHGTSEATVRSQLNRTLQKAGVARQPDLVRLLLSMPLRRVAAPAEKPQPTRH